MFGIQIQEYPLRSGRWIVMPSYDRIDQLEMFTPNPLRWGKNVFKVIR